MTKLVYRFAALYDVYKYQPEIIKEAIEELTKDHMPSGSGFVFTTFNFGESSKNKLVFNTAYNHSNNLFGDEGWTEHSVIVQPDFIEGFTVEITGNDLNDINEYIGEIFIQILTSEG